MPDMTDAPIEILPYDPRWPAAFEAERLRLQGLLAPWLRGAIEHIGSTAVPGLVAKPVIDIMAPVLSLENARPAIAVLGASGYCHAEYQADAMHWFCKPSPELRTHHLHLVPMGSALWRERIAFREALRITPALAAEYAQLKLRLATEFRNDRDGYTEAKTPFVKRILSAC
jgi:GrpB-like predicted nucleotidyltransferase (UPF0157 family)